MARHLHVITSVPHHQRPARVEAGLFQYVLEHLRMRLGKGFIGAARGTEKMSRTAITQYPIQSTARLAGRHGEQITLLCQRLQALAHARKKLHSGLVEMHEMLAVSLHHLRAFRRIDLRQKRSHRLVQAQANDMAYGLFPGIGHVRVRQRRRETAHDFSHGIHERSVPVENNQFRPMIHV